MSSHSETLPYQPLTVRDRYETTFTSIANAQTVANSIYDYVLHSLLSISKGSGITEEAPFAGLKLTSVYILGDDLSALNVALF